MLVSNVLGFIFVILITIAERTLSIMVPTGKIGPITPRKFIPEPVIQPSQYRAPAEVWERVDEGPNPYQPPIYKYTLYEYARKYGPKTLISPPEDEYYRPRYYKYTKPVYYKTKFYYSPLQFL